MSDLNNPLVGVAARDRASMRGTSPEDRIAGLEDRIARLERALTYAMQLPREIVLISNETYEPVPFDSDGRLYMRSAESPGSTSSTDIGRRPHARQHVIDLVVNAEWIKARLLEDTDWLDVVCNYCDTAVAPPAWPGG